MKNNLRSKKGGNPDFDLDDYIQEQSEDSTQDRENVKPQKNTGRRIGFLMIITALLMLYFMNPLEDVNEFFANSNPIEQQTNESETSIEQVVIPPEPPIVNAPSAPAVTEDRSESFERTGTLIDYIGVLKTFDMADDITVRGYEQLYNEVPLGYIRGLEDADVFDDLSSGGIIYLYRQNIPLEYIKGMGATGIFDDMTSGGMAQMYKDGIPITYVQTLSETDLFDEMSGSGMLALYRQQIPTEYITNLSSLGLFDYMNAGGMLALYRSDIPFEFYQQLAADDLFDEMSPSGALSLFREDLPEGYISSMGESDIFDEMNANGVITLYRKGVPASFYGFLQDRDIEDLTFSDVLALYEANAE